MKSPVQSNQATKPSRTSTLPIRTHTTTSHPQRIARTQRRSLKERNPSLAAKIADMKLILHPIFPVHIPDGSPHTAFPRTVLAYWLLTEDQIDAFAAYYSQSRRDAYTDRYPTVMNWDAEFLRKPRSEADVKKGELNAVERLAIKRRMVGKFIGLRGCETPKWEMEAKVRWIDERVGREVEEEKMRERVWKGGRRFA